MDINNKKKSKSIQKLTAALQDAYVKLLDQKIEKKLELVICSNGKTQILSTAEIIKYRKTILKKTIQNL